MTVQLEVETPDAVLTRIEELIEELQDLRLVVKRLQKNGESTLPINHGPVFKTKPFTEPVIEDIVEKLWGSFGQQSMDDIRREYQQDIYLEIFSDEPAH